MAFSMFIRNSACSNRIFTQQVMRLATQPMMQRAVAASVPLKNLSISDAQTKPILNAVRSFRTTAPRRSDEHPHDHSRLWVIEKATTAAMVPLMPIALLLPNKLCDSILAILMTAHMFWGLEAIAVDYVRASLFGPLIPKLSVGLVYLVCIATLGGLFYIISHDVGLSNAIRQLWSVKPGQAA